VFVDKEAEEFKKILLNKKLVDTKRRGKYFILRKKKKKIYSKAISDAI
jgi:formamidopyrimidine-DNA glycosylase